MKIAIRVFDGITMFHLAAPLLVFGEVTRLGLAEGWEVTTWSGNGRSVRTAEGLVLDDLRGPEAAAEADLLVFPSWPTDLPAPEAGADAALLVCPSWPTDLPEPEAELLERIATAHDRGATVAGLCLGAFPVVASGVLDGRAAVTHWEGAGELARRRGAVEVRSSDLYIDHGDVLTSAGTASSRDACLHLVRVQLGAAKAARLARHIVVAPHREGDQAQYIQQPIPECSVDDQVGETIEWALENLDQRLSVDD